MKALSQLTVTWLRKRSHLLLNEPSPPQRILVRCKSSAVTATLDFGHSRRQVVVKRHPPAENALEPGVLFAVHESIRAHGEPLAHSLPRFLAYDADHRLIVMEYVAGSTLLKTLTDSLGFFAQTPDETSSLLEEAARVLAALHNLPPDEVGVPPLECPNSIYLARFEKTWNDPLLQRFLPGICRSPKQLYDRLLPSFFAADGRHLILTDPQPKNVLVRGSGQVCFIDVDYSRGNAAIDLAEVLVALDRLGLRHPLPSSALKIEMWKRSFLGAYYRHGDTAVALDLIFFYCYMLLQAMREHMTRRPWFRRYLTSYYARRLRQFLSTLMHATPSDVRRPTPELFVPT